ncbi:hypothetical protein AO716_05245 [Arthrobacter sp. Edens01]|nr:hypothetical protein AO716_05245 [Arthrobacter sp. Edens01]
MAGIQPDAAGLAAVMGVLLCEGTFLTMPGITKHTYFLFPVWSGNLGLFGPFQPVHDRGAEPGSVPGPSSFGEISVLGLAAETFGE